MLFRSFLTVGDCELELLQPFDPRGTGGEGPDRDRPGNTRGDKGAIAIAAGCCQAQALRRLELGSNLIGQRGASALAAMLEKNTGLEVLDIELARITDDCDPRSFEAALELGGEVGAKHMIMSAWTTRRDDRNFLLAVYAETCDLAAPFTS